MKQHKMDNKKFGNINEIMRQVIANSKNVKLFKN